MNKVLGQIKFDDKVMDVYSSLDKPLFKANDIAGLMEYSAPYNMLNLCEEDEKVKLAMEMGNYEWFITEMGLYNILAQSRKPIARKWRRIVHQQLIELRKERNFSILQQFDEWDHMLDDIYFDEETGIMMQSVTVAGGDVEQVPYEGEVFWNE